MNTFFKLDETHLNNRLRTLMRLEQKSRSEMLKQEMRLMLEMAVRMTAPFSTGQSATEALGKQKKLGEESVRKDLDSMFLHDLKPDAPGPWRRGEELLRSEGEAAANAYLKAAGSARVWAADVASKPLHDRGRRNGKVNRRKPAFRYILPNEGALKSYTKKTIRHVGKTKAGWAVAAVGLGAGPKAMPAWIRRHMGTSRGLFIHTGKGTDKERYQARNQVPWVASNPAHRRIESMVYKHRLAKLDQRIARMKRAVSNGWKRSK